jgi:hypothetical protein
MFSVIVGEVTGKSGNGILVSNAIYFDCNIFVTFFGKNDSGGLDEGSFGDASGITDDLEIRISVIVSGFFERAFERFLEVEHDGLRKIVHVFFLIHAQKSHFFFNVERKMSSSFFVVSDIISLEKCSSVVEIYFFDTWTFFWGKTVIDGNFSDLVEMVVVIKFELRWIFRF